MDFGGEFEQVSQSREGKRRLQKIAGMVADLEYYRAFAAKRARKTRRASTTCHAIRPGIPRINSRTRAIKESAKAASPGIPSKLPTTTYPPSCTPSAPGTGNTADRIA